MNVEKLKKINQLSKEFKKQGMAMEEAISQASESVNEKEVKEFLNQSKKEMESSNPSATEQYIIMLERNNRKIMEEVQKVKQEITKILNEFEQIKRQINQPQNTSKDQTTEPKPTKKAQKQTRLKNKKQDDQHKEGFTPEDVSIEKMFYFGNK